jgi:uncharacterized LabA/DUF88 family protein
MLFVDGENFTIRGQEFAQAKTLEFVPGKYWLPDVYLWFPSNPSSGGSVFQGLYPDRPVGPPQRAHYYTSAVGSDDTLNDIRERIWRLQFSPSLFKKSSRDKPSKGVDITLATDMLSGAYKATYETAVLVAGDADYVPLVEEVRRQGRRVSLMFYGPDHGLNKSLRLAADSFTNLEDWTIRRWKHHASLVRRGVIQDGEPIVPTRSQPASKPRGEQQPGAEPPSQVPDA